MENPLAIAVRQSRSADELHAQFFSYFRQLFRSRPGADVRGTSILSHNFPDSLFADRRYCGVAIAGALMAILDHETDLGSEAPFIRITEDHRKILDEIIISQAAIAGAILQTSDLVLSRVLEWERKDDRKYTRWLKALGKAARIHQLKTAAPITDIFSPQAKRAACEQLRPVLARLRERFSKQRRLPKTEQIIEAFRQQADSPEAPEFLTHPHNYQCWERWLEAHRLDLVKIVSSYSAERLFDSYAAYTSGHSDPEYVRQQISRHIAGEREERAGALLARVEEVLDQAKDLVEAAKAQKNIRAANGSLRTTLACLELIGKLTGELVQPNSPGIHLTSISVTDSYASGSDKELAELVGEATGNFSIDEFMRLKRLVEPVRVGDNSGTLIIGHLKETDITAVRGAG